MNIIDVMLSAETITFPIYTRGQNKGGGLGVGLPVGTLVVQLGIYGGME